MKQERKSIAQNIAKDETEASCNSP